MSDYVINIDKDYIDRNGNSPVRSNKILSVFYYDASGESWTRDYRAFVDLADPTLQTLVSGTGTTWYDASVTTVTGSFTVASHYLMLSEEYDLIRNATASTQSSSFDGSHTAENLRQWPLGRSDSSTDAYTNTPFRLGATTGWAKFTLAGLRQYDTLYIDWLGLADDHSNIDMPKGFHVETSLDDVSYTTVYSGTTTSGVTYPVIADLTPGVARYVRLNINSTWGGTRPLVSEFTLFEKSKNKSTASIWSNDCTQYVSTTYGSVKTNVDLTNIDKLFFDFGGHIMLQLPSAEFRLLVAGATQFSYIGPSGGDTDIAYYGYSVDTSSYTGTQSIEYRVYGPNTAERGRNNIYGWLSRCSSKPTWFTEPFSENRGSKSAFPDKTVIVVDAAGLSIIDMTVFDSAGNVSPVLWKRINFGDYVFGDVKNVSANNGKIYVSSSDGLFIVDFTNDRVDRYTSTGHYRMTGLINVNQLRQIALQSWYSTSYNSVRRVESAWQTISTAAASQLNSTNVLCLETGTTGLGDYAVGGTELGSFALVSGTVYKSFSEEEVKDIKVNSDVVLLGLGRTTDSKVGFVWDISTMGYASFNYDDVLFQDASDKTYSFGTDYDKSQDWLEYDRSSTLITTTSGNYTTISGTFRYLDAFANRTAYILREPIANRPFKASMYVKIDNWPDICPGEFRFGVFNNELSGSDIQHMSLDRGLYLSARNGYSVPVYSDRLDDGIENQQNILVTRTSTSNVVYPMEVLPEGAFMFFHRGGDFTSVRSVNTVTPGLGLKLNFKFRVYESIATAEFRIGLNNSGGNDYLVFGTIKDGTYPAGAYFVKSYLNNTLQNQFYYPFQGTDGSLSLSVYRDIELIFSSNLLSMTGFVNGVNIGTVSISSWGGVNPNIYCQGFGYNYGVTSIFNLIKDMKIDFFGASPSSNNRKYAVCTKTGPDRGPYGIQYIWGDASNPYKEVFTATFSGTEGTTSDPWRKWEIYYDPQNSCFSGYIDNYYIGSTNLTLTEKPIGSLALALDWQFYPGTTTTGNDFLNTHIKDFSLQFLDGSFRNIPGLPSDFTVLPSGALYSSDITVSTHTDMTAPQQDLYQATMVFGSEHGVKKVSLLKPAYLVDGTTKAFTFADNLVPTGWTTWNMAGATGSATWTAASGILKQTGTIYGHGDTILPVGRRYAGPFGTHLVTNVSCDRTTDVDSKMVGNAIVCRLKSASSGTYGVCFNGSYDTFGTTASSSGYYIGFHASDVEIGHFQSVTTTSPTTYSAVYTPFFSGAGKDYVKTGMIRNIGLHFTSTSGVDVYLDSEKIYSLYDTNSTLRDGYLSIFANNNNRVEVYDVYAYRREYINASTSTQVIKTPTLYGDFNKSLSVKNDVDIDEDSGFIEVGTSEFSKNHIWHKLDNIPVDYNPFFISFLPCLAISDEEDSVVMLAGTNTEGTIRIVVYEYDLILGKWVSFGFTPKIVSTTDAYTSGNFENIYDIGRGVKYLFMSPNPYRYVYTIVQQTSGVVYDVNRKLVLGNQELVTSNSAKFAPYNYVSRTDGYSIPLGNDRNFNVTKPAAFCWADGSLYLSIGVVNQVLDFYNVFPDKAHASAYATSGYHAHSDTQSANPWSANHFISYAYCSKDCSLYFLTDLYFKRFDFITNSWFTLEAPQSYVERTPADTYEGYYNPILLVYSDRLDKFYAKIFDYPSIFCYDRHSGKWEDVIDIPYSFSSVASSMIYSNKYNKIFFGPGSYDSTNHSDPRYFYELQLPEGDYKKIYYKPSIGGVLPESSKDGSFCWVGPDTFVKDEPFVYSGVNWQYWVKPTDGANYPSPWSSSDGLVGPSSNLDATLVQHKSFVTAYNGKLGGVSTRVPLKPFSFDATVKVRLTANPQESGNVNRFFVFGVSEGRVSTGRYNANNQPSNKLLGRGSNSLYLGTVNNTSYPGRYTLIKQDGSTVSHTGGTEYISFYGGETTTTGTYKDWKVSFDATSNTLTGYIDDVLVGSESLSSDFSDMFIEIGALNGFINNVYHKMEFKDFTIDLNGGKQTHYLSSPTELSIVKDKYENGDYYFVREFPYLEIDSNFAYKANVKVDSYSNSVTPYVCSLGRVRDGNKEIHLCAITDGAQKKIGFWTGRDPWITASGYENLYSVDWSEYHTYKLIKNDGVVSVYVDDELTPSITQDYSLFPVCRRWNWRSISFGNISIPDDQYDEMDGSLDAFTGGTVISGGTWTRLSDAVNRTWRGTYLRTTTSVGSYSKYLQYNINLTTSGTKYIYSTAAVPTNNGGTSVPYTVYHSGVVETPTADSFATNNIVSVNLNTSHSGSVFVGATTIDLDDKKLHNGESNNVGISVGQGPIQQGFCYLGAYTNPTSVYVTSDTAGTYVYSPTIFVYDYDRSRKLLSKSTTVWKEVSFVLDEADFESFDKRGGVSIIDTQTSSLVDFYSTDTDPVIGGSNITTIDRF